MSLLATSLARHPIRATGRAHLSTLLKKYEMNTNSTSQGENLIFLISQPRAGSTLLQRILENHSEVHTAAEPWIMLHPLYALRAHGYNAEYNAAWSRLAVNDFIQLLPEGKETYYRALRQTYAQLYQALLENSGKRYFLDKTPRYYHIIPELYQVFPKAKFIILIRNPVAVLCSIINTWIKESWSHLRKYQHDLIQAPQLLLEGAQLISSENCLVVSYENLLTSPEKQVEEICQFLEIPFSEQMIHYGNVEKKGFGYQEQRQDLHLSGLPQAQNLDRWISDLRDPQIWRVVNDYVELLGAELLDRMGYQYEELKQITVKYKPYSFNTWNVLPLQYFLSPPRGYQKWKYNLFRFSRVLHQQGLNKTIKYLQTSVKSA